MSKIITCPVKRWPGTVTISDPLNYPQAIAVEAAIDNGSQLGEQAKQREYNFVVLPAFLACVEKWDLEGLPPQITVDTFPATPPVSSAQLLAWIMGEVTLLYREADESPNE